MTRRAARASWTGSEPGLLTATCRGEVVGYVVVAEGGFLAFDATRTPIGFFTTLHRARRRVVSPLRSSRSPIRAWVRRAIGILRRPLEGGGERSPTTPA